MNLKLLSFCAIATATAAREHHIRANSNDPHQLQFRATESALRRLLEREESTRSNKAEALHVLRGSGRDLKNLNCPDGADPPIWTCNKHTQQCGTTAEECIQVCDETDNCNDHGKCKNGECECDYNFKGEACDKCAKGYYHYKDDCENYDVDVEYQLNYVIVEGEDEEVALKCLETIDSMHSEIKAIVDDFPDEATVEVSGSGKSKHDRHRKSALVIDVDVVVDDCDRDALLQGALFSIEVEDIAVPSGFSFRTSGSRD